MKKNLSLEINSKFVVACILFVAVVGGLCAERADGDAPTGANLLALRTRILALQTERDRTIAGPRLVISVADRKGRILQTKLTRIRASTTQLTVGVLLPSGRMVDVFYDVQRRTFKISREPVAIAPSRHDLSGWPSWRNCDGFVTSFGWETLTVVLVK